MTIPFERQQVFEPENKDDVLKSSFDRIVLAPARILINTSTDPSVLGAMASFALFGAVGGPATVLTNISGIATLVVLRLVPEVVRAYPNIEIAKAVPKTIQARFRAVARHVARPRVTPFFRTLSDIATEPGPKLPMVVQTAHQVWAEVFSIQHVLQDGGSGREIFTPLMTTAMFVIGNVRYISKPLQPSRELAAIPKENLVTVPKEEPESLSRRILRKTFTIAGTPSLWWGLGLAFAGRLDNLGSSLFFLSSVGLALAAPSLKSGGRFKTFLKSEELRLLLLACGSAYAAYDYCMGGVTQGFGVKAPNMVTHERGMAAMTLYSIGGLSLIASLHGGVARCLGAGMRKLAHPFARLKK